MRLPSPGLHCLCCDVPSVRRSIQHLADVGGDVRQGGFTRCRWRSRFWAVFGTRRSCWPILGSPWGGRRLLTTCPQAEFASKYALHQGEEVGHDIAHGAALAACLQLVEYFLAMLRRQSPQGGLHVLLLICLDIAQARRQVHRLRCRIAVAFARAVRTFFLYIYVLYVLPCSAVVWQACSVCCGISVLPAESPDNGSGSAGSLAGDGGVGGKSSSSRN